MLPVFYFAGFEFEWRLELALFRQGLSKSINCPVKLNHPNVMKSQSQIVIRRSDERYFSFQTTDFLQIRGNDFALRKMQRNGTLLWTEPDSEHFMPDSFISSKSRDFREAGC